MNPISPNDKHPCINCEMRYAGFNCRGTFMDCHDSCIKYSDWKNENKKE